jgi:hypothetical protein
MLLSSGFPVGPALAFAPPPTMPILRKKHRPSGTRCYVVCVAWKIRCAARISFLPFAAALLKKK